METASVIVSFLVATLLGFMIGLERERKRELTATGSIFAGVRTFTLIALFGAISGVLSGVVGTVMIVLGLAALGTLLALAYWRSSTGMKIGGTTEIAALVAFGLGVLAGLNQYVIALAGAVIATAVLSLREELHNLAGALSREDLFAAVQFAAVSLVILPLVPNENFGPWGVWNPRTIWLLVVLISGISFVGYLAAKLIGTKRGIGLSGILGGLASSTAVTLSFSERSKTNPGLGLILAVGVLAASAVMVPRFVILLGIVRPSLILGIVVPYALLFVITTIGGAIVFRRSRKEDVEGVALSNPFELKTALQFALLFALILLLARAAQEYLGESGIYLASVLAGLVRPDAIILTLGQQVGDGLDPAVAAHGLVLAAASNTLLKAGLALGLGSGVFGRAVLATLMVAAVAAVAAAWLLPPLALPA
ncbi:MAG TPA: DUF4010 domain-containing protein [Trueperaceae bacterium]